jgi:uncharacterized membrane protein
MTLHFVILWFLAILFLIAGVAHFTSLQKQYIAIIPKALPYPQAIVQITGILEIAGGIGLLILPVSRLAGIGLILFLIAVFPANVVAARLRYPFHNPLWMRALAQIVLIGVITWATLF